jgi:uncharacterized protein YukE
MAKEMDFQFGFDANGIEKLLEEIRGKVITNAANDAVNKLNIITKACDANWQGQSREDFKVQLGKDAEQFKNALTTLYNAFEKEIANAGFNFDNFDKNLFK